MFLFVTSSPAEIQIILRGANYYLLVVRIGYSGRRFSRNVKRSPHEMCDSLFLFLFFLFFFLFFLNLFRLALLKILRAIFRAAVSSIYTFANLDLVSCLLWILRREYYESLTVSVISRLSLYARVRFASQYYNLAPCISPVAVGCNILRNLISAFT